MRELDRRYLSLDAYKTNQILRDVLLAAAAIAALVVSARLSFPHPFSATPVPVTCQVLAVLTLGLVLPRRQALASVSAYLALGIAGAPVFAWGVGGAAVLFGPTGGYLLGFLPAVYMLGGAEADGRLSILTLRALGGLFAIYLAGFSWLVLLIGDAATALRVGVTPFIAPDLLKLVVAVSASFIIRRAFSK